MINILYHFPFKIDNIARYFYLIFVKNASQYCYIDQGFLLTSDKEMKLDC
jgi:hypothetical protein